MKDDNLKRDPAKEVKRTEENKTEQTAVNLDRDDKREEKLEDKSLMDFAPGSGGGSAGDGAAA
jgi:hypothetical protein